MKTNDYEMKHVSNNVWSMAEITPLQAVSMT